MIALSLPLLGRNNISPDLTIIKAKCFMLEDVMEILECFRLR